MAQPRLFHLLHLSHRALFRAADKELTNRFGISAAQHAALLYLAANEGASMSALAAAISLKASATSGLVNRMEQKGYLERRQAASDGRSFELYLQDAGRVIVTESKSLIAETNKIMLEGFSAEERNQLATFFETIIERADAFGRDDNKDPKGKRT